MFTVVANEVAFGLEEVVELRGDFAEDGWTKGAPMTFDGKAWRVTVPIAWQGKVLYKFRIVFKDKSEKWIADPTNPEGEDDGFGGKNSKLVRTARRLLRFRSDLHRPRRDVGVQRAEGRVVRNSSNAALTASGFSSTTACPAPSMMTSRAPAMPSAISRLRRTAPAATVQARSPQPPAKLRRLALRPCRRRWTSPLRAVAPVSPQPMRLRIAGYRGRHIG